MTFRVSSAHEEAGDRVYSVSTKEFLGDDDGNVRALRLVDVVFEGGKLTEIEGTEREVSRRLIDFASGLCYGLNGSMEKVATGVYLLKPMAGRGGGYSNDHA